MSDNGLTKTETNTLSACESDIERGGRLMGEAMQAIRDKKLYRAYGTFEDYCFERWGITKRHANRLISHERVVANLVEVGPIGPKITEAATREIADLPPAKQVEVVQKAIEGGEKVTAKAVKEAREEVSPKADKPEKPKRSKFDDKAYQAPLGQLVRWVNTREGVVGGESHHAACKMRLGQFEKAVAAWQKENPA